MADHKKLKKTQHIPAVCNAARIKKPKCFLHKIQKKTPARTADPHPYSSQYLLNPVIFNKIDTTVLRKMPIIPQPD